MYILHIKLSFQVCIRLLSLTLQTGRTQPEIHMYVHVYLHLLIYMYIVFVHYFLICSKPFLCSTTPVLHMRNRVGLGLHIHVHVHVHVYIAHMGTIKRELSYSLYYCVVYTCIYIYIYRLYHAVEVVS